MMTSVYASTDQRVDQLVEHVKRCIALGEQKKSPLTDAVLNIPGMSGYKVKHFLNNLCSIPGTSYLEIGCWKGSTLVAALYGNERNVRYAVAIDNWTEFGGPRNEFISNTRHFLTPNMLHFYEQDCFSINKIACFSVPVNIYFYDGQHSAESQERAFTYFDEVFDDVFIAIVDDWNWEAVREGTYSAFTKLNYEICFDQALYTNKEGDPESWWNGIYVAVIKKSA